MWSFANTLRYAAVLRILQSVAGLPAPQMSQFGENTGPVGGVNPPIPTVTAASGSLYGPSDLLGEVYPPEPVSGGDSAIVSDVTLVNGQEADSDLGLYLDFNGVEIPQPIRGDGGQTDPGPSKFSLNIFGKDVDRCRDLRI
jgi:hypothetical protein